MTVRPALSRPCRRRVVLYSHDTQGLGHTRRNIVIAAALVTARPDTDVLVLTGSPEATALPLPPRTEVLTLPTLYKHVDGHYSPRVLSSSLADVLRMRSRLIETALSTFEPDLFIVDKVARGVQGSLDAALTTLRRDGGTRTVLGLRDVLDEPLVAVREWAAADTTEAIRDLYDEVWVYGDPVIYDPVEEYSLPPSVADKVVYTGYLAGPRPPCLQIRYLSHDGAAPPQQPFVLCLVGGGQDGVDLARAFLRARLPPGLCGVVLTGPYMPRDQRRELLRDAESRADMTVREFVSGADEFVRRASAAVSMGGYNSVCELLGAGCASLLVPRVTPRMEQALRAARLARAGWVDVLPLAEATPGRITEWLSRSTGANGTTRRTLDLGGLTRIPRLAERLCAVQAAREVSHGFG
ncbi:MAG: glycosyltransferase family protein [Pseudonocardiaceae bacterium]